MSAEETSADAPRSIGFAKLRTEAEARDAQEPPRSPIVRPELGPPTMRCRFIRPYPEQITFRNAVVYLEDVEWYCLKTHRFNGIFQARKITETGTSTMELFTTNSFCVSGMLYDSFLVVF